MSKLEMFFTGMAIFSSGVAAVLFHQLLKLAKIISTFTKTQADDALVEWAFNFDAEMRKAVNDLNIKHEDNKAKIERAK